MSAVNMKRPNLSQVPGRNATWEGFLPALEEQESTWQPQGEAEHG